MMAPVRKRLADWIAPKRQNAIQFSPQMTNSFFGTGIGSNQPDKEALLRENVGVADICTRAIANRIASLVPVVKTSRRTSVGTLEDEILDDHILKSLLDRPHRNFTRQQLFRFTAQSIVTVGEAYWLKISNKMRLAGELQPMPAQFVEPVVRGGYIDAYQVQRGDGSYDTMEARDVVRFWFPDPETLYLSEGYLGPNGVNTDAAAFASQHLRAHYQNDATPTTLFQASADAIPPSDDQWRRYVEDWINKHNRRTGQKIGAPALIPPGWEAVFAAIQTGAEVTPLLEHWQSNQLMNFGVPASILGRVISGDRSSAETNAFVFDKHTVAPIAMMIADTITAQLANDYDDKIFVDWEDFVQEDKEYLLKQEAQDLALKVRSPQQVIADREGDPEIAPWGEYPVGTFGEVPYTGEERSNPFDLRPDDPNANTAPQEPEDDSPPTDDGPRTREMTPAAEQLRIVLRERKFRPPMERALRSIFEAQRLSVQKQLEQFTNRSHARQIEVGDLFDPAGWGELFDVKALTVLERAYIYAFLESLVLLGISTEFQYTPTIQAALRAQGAELIQFVNQTTKARLADKVQRILAQGVEEGWPTKKIAKSLKTGVNELFTTRRHNAGTIARTELHRASIAAQLESFNIGNVPWKQWVDQRDSSVRDEHQASRIPPVARNQPFIVGGYAAMGPGDRGLPPELSINCRCGVIALYRDPAGIEKP